MASIRSFTLRSALSFALNPFAHYDVDGRPEPMRVMMAVIAKAIEKI
ncbi:hypothetical protein [Novosphingobium sp. BL-8A]